MHGQGNYQDERIHPSNGPTNAAAAAVVAVNSSSPQQDYGPFPSSSDGRPLPTTIFLDSGGVINDNERRGPQWIHHLSNLMPRLFGGPAKHWGESNRRFCAKIFEVTQWNAFVACHDSFADFDRAYNLLWLETMADIVDELLLQDRLAEWQKTGGVHHHHQQHHHHHHDHQEKKTKGGEEGGKDITTATAKVTAPPESAPSSTKRGSNSERQHTILAPTLAMANKVFAELTELAQTGQSMVPEDDQMAPITHVTLPASVDDRVALAKALNDFCVGLVQADYPGARDAILRMRIDQQLAIYTCSNEVSSDLHATFQAIDLLTLPSSDDDDDDKGREGGRRGGRGKGGEPVFTKLYGPDLVNQMKNGEAYYARIFEDCGVDPTHSIVVDDKELMLSWAKPLGVTTVQINKKRSATPMLVPLKDADGRSRKVPAVDFHLESLAQLPDLLDAWKASLVKK
ncbi:hypothetical protein DFQ27_006435 [Actinomortierella ambigua]|uniref:Uncharacterized protein n=1 Tax=Actinomortierella ambigua TaxID=1343610 RepID=A0A9P6PXM6_9FUNG|nr:hypothetical protein DFQ27_006435 [Actinomortierella ambigua]